jgi:hypothetical protein
VSSGVLYQAGFEALDRFRNGDAVVGGDEGQRCVLAQADDVTE